MPGEGGETLDRSVRLSSAHPRGSEVIMKKILFPACVFLVCIGCERSTFAPVPPPAPRLGQTLIVNGFDNSITAYVNNNGYRLAKYFDFRFYDSLGITFTGERDDPGDETVPISIKIGPAYYVRGSLTDQKQEFAFVVDVHKLGKPQFAGLSFFIPDSAPPLVLSNLRVVGWYSY
jgi:hypothetical protein